MSQADHEDISTGSSRPAEHRHLFGHQEAQQAFLSAVAGNRLPHAWLISGPSGVGKATLAYAMARLMLSGSLSTVVNQADQALDTTTGLEGDPHDESIDARIAEGSNGDRFCLSRPRKRLKQDSYYKQSGQKLAHCFLHSISKS